MGEQVAKGHSEKKITETQLLLTWKTHALSKPLVIWQRVVNINGR